MSFGSRLIQWFSRMRLTAYLCCTTAVAISFTVGCNREPTLSSHETEWQLYTGDQTQGEKVVITEHGYKFIRAYHRPAWKSEGREHPATDMVEWGWKVLARPVGGLDALFDDFPPCGSFRYELRDQDGFVVDSVESDKRFLRQDEVVAVLDTGNIRYDQRVRAVEGSVKWKSAKGCRDYFEPLS
jgi:hypothetical protein